VGLALAAIIIGSFGYDGKAQVQESPNKTVYQRRANGEGAAFIGHGQKADFKEFPFQVALLSHFAPPGQEFNFSFCAGTLISATWVLTAAHCLVDDRSKAGDIDVYVGSGNFEGGDRIPLKRVVPHDKYHDAAYGYDIELLELERPPREGTLYHPIELDDGRPAPIVDANLIIIGWGQDEHGNDQKDLRQATTKMLDRKVCDQLVVGVLSEQLRRQLKWDFHITDKKNVEKLEHLLKPILGAPILKDARVLDETMICTGNQNHPPQEHNPSICKGDSGGPLLRRSDDGKLVQIGIASRSTWRCGDPRSLNIFTQVSGLFSWIRDQQNKPPERRDDSAIR
jgi:secreted trypsin-like serine protease